MALEEEYEKLLEELETRKASENRLNKQTEELETKLQATIKDLDSWTHRT